MPGILQLQMKFRRNRTVVSDFLVVVAPAVGMVMELVIQGVMGMVRVGAKHGAVFFTGFFVIGTPVLWVTK